MIQPMSHDTAMLLNSQISADKMEFNSDFSPIKAPVSKLGSTRAQDVSVKSYKRRLVELEKELKECKRENYETFEEYMQEKQFIINEYENVQKLLNEHDARYTEVNTDAQNKTLGAIGGLFKDIGEALKTAGNEIIKTIGSLFGFKSAE